jgi:hypothetical protein
MSNNGMTTSSNTDVCGTDIILEVVSGRDAIQGPVDVKIVQEKSNHVEAYQIYQSVICAKSSQLR